MGPVLRHDVFEAGRIISEERLQRGWDGETNAV